MGRIVVLSLLAALCARPLFAGLRPVFLAGYEIEEGDFEGSSDAPLLGAGLEGSLVEYLWAAGDYMVCLHDNPSNPGRVSYLEGGGVLKVPVSRTFSPRTGMGLGMAFDARGDKAVGGIWYFDAGVEIATHRPILETISFQYRLHSLPAADIHRLFVAFGF